MRRAVLCMWACLLLGTGGVTAAEAQTSVLNPRVLKFDASTSHNATVPGGQPAVTRYEVRWYVGTAPQPFQTNDLGKPTPVNGQVTIDIATQIGMIPFGTGYIARVVAIGPAGEGVSEPSAPFDRVSPPGPATNVTLER